MNFKVNLHTQEKIEKKAKAIAACTLLRPFHPDISGLGSTRH